MMERITYVVPCTSQEWPSVNYIVYTSKKVCRSETICFDFSTWSWAGIDFWALIMYIIEIVNIILSTPSSYIFPLHIGLIRHVDKITALLFYFTKIRARVYTCIFKMPVNTDSCNLICKLLIDRSLRCCLNIYQSYMRLTEDFLWRKKTDDTINITLFLILYIYSSVLRFSRWNQTVFSEFNNGFG